MLSSTSVMAQRMSSFAWIPWKLVSCAFRSLASYHNCFHCTEELGELCSAVKEPTSIYHLHPVWLFSTCPPTTRVISDATPTCLQQGGAILYTIKILIQSSDDRSLQYWSHAPISKQVLHDVGSDTL